MKKKKQKKIKKLSADKFDRLKEAIDKFCANKLEYPPFKAKDIYTNYTYVDALYVWLKDAYNDDMCVLCNEMRAVLGHLAEYDEEDDDKKRNLTKAYGHLRRLGIDSLKILCNGLDEIFEKWIFKYSKYDYSNIDNEYLPKYIKKYYIAHNEYLQVQKAEKLGSDRENAIIVKYHEAAKKYLDLYELHIYDRRTRIERRTLGFKFNNIIIFGLSLILCLLSIVDVIL